jgi:hypothetical protein
VDASINYPLLGKLLVVLILIPAWLPVVRELWREINASLIEEGGVFGELPTQAEARRLFEERRRSGASLLSVPRDGHAGRSRRQGPGAVQKGPGQRSF